MNSATSLRRPPGATTSVSSPAVSPPTTTTAPSEKRPPETIGTDIPIKRRDPRLDFFRGVGMLIILIAHIPNDNWALWIPARFGFSDATEMFVFQSGMASAIAFGATYDRMGLFALAARVAQRIWQLLWSHVSVFIIVTAIMVSAGTRFDGVSYVDSLNLVPFMRDPGHLLGALLTLRYVPNYFDILPMYIIVLALMPVMLVARKVHVALPILAMAALWLASQVGILDLPAEPWSDRTWFFNPFGWQLLFFTGFFIMRGDIPLPPKRRSLLLCAVAVAVATVPFAWVKFQEMHPFFREAANDILFLTDKTHFGVLRFVHYLALCYIVVHAVGENGRRLRGPIVSVVSVVGQQSLAVFVTGMVAAQIIGVGLDLAGRTLLAEAIGNIAGFATLIATAFFVRWFKTAPWR